MKKNKISGFLIAAAVVLLTFSMAGSARAALTYYSEDYVAQIDVKSIGVTLTENGNDISWRNYTHKDDEWNKQTGVLLGNMLADAGDEQLVLNKKYKEELAVRNSGTIDEYVRVSLYCYWTDEEGNEKRMDLDPKMIDLHLTGNGWIPRQRSGRCFTIPTSWKAARPALFLLIPFP